MDQTSIYTLLASAVFIIGYILIVCEHWLKINKATSALLAAITLWVIVFSDPSLSRALHLGGFREDLAEIMQVVLFLIGALSIVEIINVHQGFRLIQSWLMVKNKRRLLWLIGLITFFLSSVLDNLTTTIVMVSILRKIVPVKWERWVIGSGVVIAANAGGAWTPIGDVTTTMLWIGGQLSTFNIVTQLFVPSVVCMVVSFLFFHFMLKGDFTDASREKEPAPLEPHGKEVFWMGVASLIFVPIFKGLTGLPPFMGMMFGLAILWFFTDYVHAHDASRKHLRVVNVIGKIDLSSIFFFLGILLAVGALGQQGILKLFAVALDNWVGSPEWIAIWIGIMSAVVDNVPLVAASMGMYDLSIYPTDSNFWELVAYAAGTGGSMLIIGSAAGVVFMGLEKVDFFWYLRRVTVPALVGYFAGVYAYFLLT